MLNIPTADAFKIQESENNPLLPLFLDNGEYKGLFNVLITGTQGTSIRGKIPSLGFLNVRSIPKRVSVQGYGVITMLTWEPIK